MSAGVERDDFEFKKGSETVKVLDIDNGFEVCVSSIVVLRQGIRKVTGKNCEWAEQ
jgi:hypothetical protein